LDNKGWEHSSIPLKFQIGDIILGKSELALFRRSARVDERPLDIGCTGD
jgi:hypothetical protein